MNHLTTAAVSGSLNQMKKWAMKCWSCYESADYWTCRICYCKEVRESLHVISSCLHKVECYHLTWPLGEQMSVQLWRLSGPGEKWKEKLCLNLKKRFFKIKFPLRRFCCWTTEKETDKVQPYFLWTKFFWNPWNIWTNIYSFSCTFHFFFNAINTM